MGVDRRGGRAEAYPGAGGQGEVGIANFGAES